MLHVIYTCKRAFNEIGSDTIALSPANRKSDRRIYMYMAFLSHNLSLSLSSLSLRRNFENEDRCWINIRGLRIEYVFARNRIARRVSYVKNISLLVISVRLCYVRVSYT